jgi:hypothetical protein
VDNFVGLLYPAESACMESPMTQRRRFSILLSFTASLLTFAASGDDFNLFRVVLPNVFGSMPVGSTPLDDENGDLAVARNSEERSLPNAYLPDSMGDAGAASCPESPCRWASHVFPRTADRFCGGSGVFPLRC